MKFQIYYDEVYNNYFHFDICSSISTRKKGEHIVVFRKNFVTSYLECNFTLQSCSLLMIVVMISSGLFLFTFKSTSFDLFGFILLLVASFSSGGRYLFKITEISFIIY